MNAWDFISFRLNDLGNEWFCQMYLVTVIPLIAVYWPDDTT